MTPDASLSSVRVERSRETPSTSLGTNGTGESTPEQKKLRAVAEQFEAVMIRQLIGSMRAASIGDGIFDSEASEQFRDMSDAKTAEAMAHQGALHIADLLVKQYGARIAPTAAAEGAGK